MLCYASIIHMLNDCAQIIFDLSCHTYMVLVACRVFREAQRRTSHIHLGTQCKGVYIPYDANLAAASLSESRTSLCCSPALVHPIGLLVMLPPNNNSILFG